MNLSKLEIDLVTYGENKGKYIGRARFAAEQGYVEVRLLPEHAHKILELCAESVVSNARSIAEQMITPVLELLPETKETNT